MYQLVNKKKTLITATCFGFLTKPLYASTCFEHMCSKQIDAWNKLIVKQTFCASSWLITEINILLNVFTFVIADTIVMFDVNYVYFCYNALVVGTKITVWKVGDVKGWKITML